MSPTLHIAHPPDPDVAFILFGLTQFDTAPEIYAFDVADIETLSRDAENGKYEVVALSFHAYAYVADKYVLLPHGASFGDNCGPTIVARSFDGDAQAFGGNDARQWLAGKTIAVPGARTSAFLALHLFACGANAQQAFSSTGDVISGRDREFARLDFKTVVVPFDQIPEVAAGKYDGGLVIREEPGSPLKKVVDLGDWWGALTGLPLPLRGIAVRKDLGIERIRRISRQLHDSIKWGLEHRSQTLDHALKYACGMNKEQIDPFVGMYVNEFTLAYGEKGRAAVRRFLGEGRRLGLITVPVTPAWAE